MSKQSEAKEAQGYVPKFKPDFCCNCQEYSSSIIREAFFEQEKKRKCGIGGFAVKKLGTCKRFVRKVDC